MTIMTPWCVEFDEEATLILRVNVEQFVVQLDHTARADRAQQHEGENYSKHFVVWVVKIRKTFCAKK